MLHYQNQLKHFFSKITLEQLLNGLILLIVLVVLILSSIASLKPISVDQYFKIKQLAQQEIYPDTQSMAQQMLTREKVYRMDYIRLMHAQHYESSRIQHYQSDTE